MSSALAIGSDGSARSPHELRARALDPWTTGPLGGGALLLLSCVSIQVGAAIATTTFSSINPAGAAGLRFAFAALVLLAVVRPRVKGWDFGRWRAVILFGVAAAGNEVCLYLALDRLPLGMAVTLEFLGPLSLAILAARRWTHMWMLGLALGGVVLLSHATFSGDPLGIGLALAAALGWALYIVASSRVGMLERPVDGLVIAVCVAALVTSPLTIWQISHVNPGVAAQLLVVALLGTILPYALEIQALRRLRAATAGVLFSIEPAIAALVGLLALGQGLSGQQVVGVVLVVAAGTFALRTASR